MTEAESVGRREFIKYITAAIAGLVIGAAAGWFSKPREVVKETITQTIRETVTTTVTITPTPSPTPTPTPTPTPLPVPTAPRIAPPPEEVKPTTIEVWTHETPPYRMARQEAVIGMFRTEYPQVKVKLVPVGWEEVYPKLLSAIKAGNPPDIDFSIPTLSMAAYQAGKDVLVPLDDFVKELDKIHKFIPAALHMARWDDHYWAVPIWNIVHVLNYRKDLMEKAGFPEGPKTWDDLLEVVKTCHGLDDPEVSGGKVYGTFLPTVKHLYTTEEVYTIMINNKARIVADDGKTVIFNSPETVEALRFYAELCKYRPPGSEDWGWAEVTPVWQQGGIATFYWWSVTLYIASKNPKMAPLATICEQPYPPGGQRGSIMFPYGAIVFKKAEERGNLDACLAFLEFILRPEVFGFLCNMEPVFFLPSTEDGLKSKALHADPLSQQYSKELETLKKAVPYGKLYGFVGEPCKFIGEIEGSDLLALVAQKVVFGEMTPEEAAKWGHEQMEKIAAKYR